MCMLSCTRMKIMITFISFYQFSCISNFKFSPTVLTNFDSEYAASLL